MAVGPIQTRIITSPVDSLAKLRRGMPASGDPRLIIELAGVGRTVIITRTQKGEGPGGTPFAKYSTRTYYAPIDRRHPGYPKPSGGTATRGGKTVKYAGGYAEYKRGIGRGARPDLTVSGSMLGAIQIANAGPTVAFLFFASALEAAKAHGHQFGTTVPKRPFFDLSDFPSAQSLEAEAFRFLKALSRKAKLELQGRAA